MMQNTIISSPHGTKKPRILKEANTPHGTPSNKKVKFTESPKQSRKNSNEIPPPTNLKREVSFLTRTMFENEKKNFATASSICGIFFLDDTPPIEEVKKLVKRKFLTYDKRFCSILTERNNSVVWEEVTVNLDRHVIQQDLPGTGDMQSLEEFFSHLYSNRMDTKYPLWYLYILTNWQNSPSKCIIVSRMHHQLGDGISLSVFWDSIYQLEDPNKKDSPYGRTGSHRSKRSFNFWDISEGIYIFLSGVFRAAIAPLYPPDTPTCIKLPDHRKLAVQKKVGFSQTFQLSMFIDIKDIVGGTINDVFISCIAGGIRRYLLKYDSEFKKSKIARIHGVFPLTTRTKKEIQLGNKFTFCPLQFPVSEEESIQRLVESKRLSDALKRSPEAAIFIALQKLGQIFLPSSIMLAIQGIMLDKFSLVFSNVPGPSQRRILAGVPIQNMTGCVNSPIGSCISLTSYNGLAMFTIVADNNVIPNAHELLVCMEDELFELHKQSQNRKKEQHKKIRRKFNKLHLCHLLVVCSFFVAVLLFLVYTLKFIF